MVMDVKYTYDKKTEENLKRFKAVLSEYEELLIRKIEERGMFKQEATEAYFSDAGRKSILEQMRKITASAIPVGIKFTGI